MKGIRRFARFFRKEKSTDGDPVSTSVKAISRILEMCGIYNFSGSKEKNWSAPGVVLLVSTLGTFLYVGQASQWVYLAQQWRDKTRIMLALDCIVTTCIPLSDFCFVFVKRSKFNELFKLTREGFSALAPTSPAGLALRRTLLRGRTLTLVVTVSFLSTHLLYVAMPLTLTLILSTRYVPQIPGELIGLQPMRESPNYELSFVFVTIGVYFSAVIVTGYTNIFITFMMHILGHIYGVVDTFNWLRDHIESKERDRKSHLGFNKEELENLTKDTLKFCVQRHQYILKYHLKFADMYKTIFGFHFLLMTIISVTTVHTYNHEWGILNTAITASVSFMPLMMYCFGGELVISANAALAHAAYDCNWEMMCPRNARTVLYVLMAAQRPVNFTAANLFPLDIETFGTVMQTVYKVYAVLR